MDKQKIAVLGAGSWGNTLALLAQNGILFVVLRLGIEPRSKV